MKNYFVTTISRVLSFIGEILSKSAEAFLRKLEFCKKTRFYPIPMGFTTVSHVFHVDKDSLGLILIYALDTCTTVCKRSHNRPYVMDINICLTFSALNMST